MAMLLDTGMNMAHTRHDSADDFHRHREHSLLCLLLLGA